MKVLALCIALLVASVARAQTPIDTLTPPVPTATPATVPPIVTDDGSLKPTQADRATCLLLDTTPGALLEPAASAQLATPIPWNDFSVDGTFIVGDSQEALHAIFEPTFSDHRTNFTDATWREVAALASKFGYQLVGHLVQDQPGGQRLVVHVAPLPLVRHIKTVVDSDSRLFGLFDKLLDDEVGRRLRVRPGSYLPWEPIRRQCAIADERERVEAYLHDEGYADASVTIAAPVKNDVSVDIRVRVDLGTKYVTGKVTVVPAAGADPLAISDAEISKLFQHEDNCIFTLCVSVARFTRTRHQDDLNKVREKFHLRG